MKKLKVIAIGGPTAAGKSDLAKEIVNQFNGEAISVDSTQIFKRLDIGTGKDKSFPQKMLDILNPGEQFSVAEFTKMALEEIEKIHRNNKIPVLVGGSGYYLDALLYERQFPNVCNPELVTQLNELQTEFLRERLKAQDISSYNRVGLNRRKIIRALEIVETSGQKVPPQSAISRFDDLFLVLDPGQDELKSNIIKRLENRLKAGLLEEVADLKKDVNKQWLENKAGLEYTYASQYLDGQISYNEFMDKLTKDIISYANRQRTWFRRYKHAVWVSENKEALKLVNNFLDF
jgi:tRNA dimethylallyltransferase